MKRQRQLDRSRSHTGAVLWVLVGSVLLFDLEAFASAAPRRARGNEVQQRLASLGAAAPAWTAAPSTAEGSAIVRASERFHGAQEALVVDPFAYRLVGHPALRFFLGGPRRTALARRFYDRRLPGTRNEIAARGAWAEELLTQEIPRGLDQVVIVGAGLDSTALRHPDDLRLVVEVDAPQAQQAKLEALRRAGLADPPSLRFLAHELTPDARALATALSGVRGYDPARPSVSVLAAVARYLPLATLEAALGGLAASAAPGSVLVTDYYARGFLDHPWGKAVADYAAQRGEPMSADSALDPATAADFYARCGWRVTADLDASGIREKILVPRRRSHEPIVPFVHFVSAERAEVGR